MIRVLFICTGNTCRSPMAEAILKNKGLEGLEVKSAGVYAGDGMPASDYAKQVLQQQNVPLEHESSALAPHLVDWATHIFTMTVGHKEALLQLFPEEKEKIFTLKEFAGEEEILDISDPFGGSLELYQKTYFDLIDSIEKMIEKL